MARPTSRRPQSRVAATVYGWPRLKMRRYVKALAPTAQSILRIIALNAPRIAVDIVQEESELGPSAYAGSMSSFGFAVKRTRGVKEKPFTKIGGTYEMDEDVAKMALDVLDELSP